MRVRLPLPLIQFLLQTSAVAGALLAYLSLKSTATVMPIDLFIIGVLATAANNFCDALVECAVEWHTTARYRTLLVEFRDALHAGSDYIIPYDPITRLLDTIGADPRYIQRHSSVDRLRSSLMSGRSAGKTTVMQLSRMSRDELATMIDSILGFYP